MIQYKIETLGDVKYGDFEAIEQELDGLTRTELEEILYMDIDDEFDIDYGVTIQRIA